MSCLSLASCEFVRMEVERSLENAKGFLFVEHAHSKEVADLQNEAASFLKKGRLSVADVPSKNERVCFWPEK